MKVKKGKLISVPYSVEINDIPFFLGKGNSGADFMQAIIDQFDVLYEEGKQQRESDGDCGASVHSSMCRFGINTLSKPWNTSRGKKKCG
jgi:hypothetical protein